MNAGNWQRPGQWHQPPPQWNQQPPQWTQQPPQWNQQPPQWRQQPPQANQWNQPQWQQPGPWQQQRPWPPPPPPSRKSGGGFLRGLFFVVIALVALWALAIFGRGLADLFLESPEQPPISSPEPRDPQPPESEPPPEPEPPPAESALPERDWPPIPPPNSDDPAWVTLQQSELNDVLIPVLSGCPPPATAESMDELEEQVTAQMACLQASWKPTLAELGYSTADVPVYFFTESSVDSPCGLVEGAPAFYCSAGGGSLYFGANTLNGTSWHEFGVKEMSGHEFGHHLQAQAGLFIAEYETFGGNESARRLELQTTCYSFAMIAADTSFEMTREIHDSFEPFLRSSVVDGIHGSHESLLYWGFRGLYSADLGNCNTWTSPSEDVD